MKQSKRTIRRIVTMAAAGLLVAAALPAQAVVLGLNYPATGPYSAMGLDQLRAAQLAIEEINADGGILGEQVELATTDSKSKKTIAPDNVAELVDQKGAKMVFGGSASSVAIAAGKAAKERGVPFFGTLTYSTTTTGKAGHKYMFRECYNAWMGAKAIASYLKEHYSGKKYFYITADYSWGYSTEASVRKFSGTEDTKAYKSVKTPFPGATEKDFKKALGLAKVVKPDVLVLVLFGKDMSTAIRIATSMGLKKKMQIVVPNLTLSMAEGGGPKVMEGVIGALPWTWKIPAKYGYTRGQKFVDTFDAKYDRYPSTSGASAYTIVYEYKAAVERAGSFDGAKVVAALEGHEYQLLKDKQVWRDFDHQSVQTVYAVKCNPEAVVKKDKHQLDYFEILSSLPGPEAVRTRDEWNAVREAAGMPTHLE